MGKAYENYITKEQKTAIEQIPEHNRWGGYKNVAFNVSIWESFWNDIYQGNKTDAILDYGAGAAWSQLVGRKLGYENISAVDIDTEEAIEQFSRWHQILGNSVDHWDGVKMPYSDDMFDSIVAKASVTKLLKSSWDSFYSEMVRISKPNCKWYIAPVYMVQRMPTPPPVFSEKKISILAWDWDRTHPCNDVFQPNMVDV